MNLTQQMNWEIRIRNNFKSHIKGQNEGSLYSKVFENMWVLYISPLNIFYLLTDQNVFYVFGN